jgi:hypothetical protein
MIIEYFEMTAEGWNSGTTTGGASSSRVTSNIARQAYKTTKQLQVLKEVVTLFSETYLKLHIRFFTSLYRPDRLWGPPNLL